MTPDTHNVDRIAVLEESVFTLLREVEALRAAMIELCRNAEAAMSDEVLANEACGVNGPHTVYGKAYLETAWLTHWSAGLSSGEDKLRDRFGLGKNQSASFTELDMLVRLGYDDHQIQQYMDASQSAENCT